VLVPLNAGDDDPDALDQIDATVLDYVLRASAAVLV
jgi:hypothetical protein